MRTLCLALILLNALYFAWAELIDGNTSDMDLARSDVVRPPPIMLASESDVGPAKRVDRDGVSRKLDETPKGELQTASSAMTTATPTTQSSTTGPCTSIGPFTTLLETTQAQGALRAIGFTPRPRFEQGGEVWVGYGVSLQNLGTQKNAEAALKRLKDSGVTDIFLSPGSNPPTVSLGLFSDYQRAQRRAAQIRELGFEPALTDRKRAEPVYWIDVDILQPGQSIDTSIFQTDQGRIMRLELRACPQPQAAG